MHKRWSILVLDDDIWITELLEAVLSSLYPDANLLIADSVEEGKRLWEKEKPGLAIIDWNLADGDGTEVIRAIRSTNTSVPVLMLTARSDRQSVLSAARLGVQDFISKPVNVETLSKRLEAQVPTTAWAGKGGAPTPDSVKLDEFLEEARRSGVRLPSALDPEELAELMALEKANKLSILHLVEQWEARPELTAHLLNATNSASMQRTGKACDTLLEAISLLGVEFSLAHASALALDIRGALRDDRLIRHASLYLKESDELSQLASRFAQQLRLEVPLCHTAGMLHRLGELATLSVAQHFLDAGGELSDQTLGEALTAWAPELGNRLKVQWRLSLPLRDLIGAAHWLTQGHQPMARLVMRMAALIVQGKAESEECRKLLKRVGITALEEFHIDLSQGIQGESGSST